VDFLEAVFSLVCGQEPAHTWGPGGVMLPFCQRCTGLYAGALAAIVLHAAFRPALTAWFLRVHGALVLAMVPLGFHWVAHGAAVRTVSGVAFGMGVVTFLLAACGRRGEASARRYWTGAGAAAGILLASCAGGEMTAAALSIAGALGLAGLLGLCLVLFARAFRTLAGAGRAVTDP
jgi:uncharacterized membrane protein